MKTKNTKVLSLILTMVLLSVCFALSASALDVETNEYGGLYISGEVIIYDDYKYIFIDEDKDEIVLIEDLNPHLDENGTYTIPSTVDGHSVKYIADYYFGRYSTNYYEVYTKAKKIVISEGIEEFYQTGEEGIMYRFDNLEEVVLPSTFTKINDYMFLSCTKLKKINLGNNIKSIGDNAFWNCDSLEEIVLPKNLEAFGNYVFYHCDNIKTITIDSNNKSFVTKNNVLFGLDKNGGRASLIYYAPMKETAKYKIPSTVKIIENGAFFSAKNLENLTITKQVASIGDAAFIGCENLEKIKTYSDSKLKTIGEGAFDNCKKLKSINIPEKVKFLGNNTFDYCNEKIKITIRNPELVIGCDIPRRATLVGYKNSTAEKYVEKYGKAEISYKKKNNIKFKSLGTGEKVYNIEIKDRGRTYLSFTWQKIDRADKYQIYVSTNNKKWKKAGESRTNSFKISDLKASTWYYIKVRAIKDGEKCKFSTVYKTATKPKTPQDVKVKLMKNSDVKVSWDKQSKVAGYEIYYSTDKNFKNDVNSWTVGGSARSYRFLKRDKYGYYFESGKTYYIKVVAYKVQEIMDYDVDYHEQEYIESTPSKTVSIKVK